jgi:endonuclease/exonuclease/phosphatase family metal-dependent hydrolase
MTYNVRRCTGVDGRTLVSRIAEIIARAQPDVVGLQEVDVNRRRSGRSDQPAELGRLLGMRSMFTARLEMDDERYGIAVLSRLEMKVMRADALPAAARRPSVEKTSAIWITVQTPDGPLQLINTHFGHNLKDRLTHVDALLGPGWLAHPDCRAPVILCGDFNTPPFSRVYKRLRARLSDAQDINGRAPRPTWPALFPIARIDHIFVSEGVLVRKVDTPRDWQSMFASDHAPLIAEIEITRGKN